jgi:hypothetical protein
LTAEEEAAAGAAATKTPTPDTERDEEGRRAELVNEGEEASNVNDEESAQEEAKRAAIAAHLSSLVSLSLSVRVSLVSSSKTNPPSKPKWNLHYAKMISILLFISYMFYVSNPPM